MKRLITIIALSISLISMAYCQTDDCICKIKNASYTGLYKGAENNLTADDLSLDLKCANKFRNEKYPNGFVTICGSSRISEKNQGKDSIINAANDKVYKDIREFAYNWTIKHSKQYPIITGAGSGIMEAGSRGAMDAGGPSIGYSTYYGPSRVLPDGDQSKVFWKYNGQDIITDGLIFTSIVTREYMLIMHSAAIVFAPGGTGTEWEFFQTIEKIKSGQLDTIPIYLYGDKEIHWRSLFDRLDDMVKRGIIKREEVCPLITPVNNINDLISLLEKRLKLL